MTLLLLLLLLSEGVIRGGILLDGRWRRRRVKVPQIRRSRRRFGRESQPSSLLHQRRENLPVVRRVLCRARRPRLQRRRSFPRRRGERAVRGAPQRVRRQHLRHGRTRTGNLGHHRDQKSTHPVWATHAGGERRRASVDFALKVRHVADVLRKWVAQREQLVQHAPERPHVAPVVVSAIVENLRAHVHQRQGRSVQLRHTQTFY